MRGWKGKDIILRIHWGLIIINLLTVTWWDLDQMTEEKCGGLRFQNIR